MMDLQTQRKIHEDIYERCKEMGATSIRLENATSFGTIDATLDGETFTVHFTLREGKYVSTDVVAKASDMIGE